VGSGCVLVVINGRSVTRVLTTHLVPAAAAACLCGDTRKIPRRKHCAGPNNIVNTVSVVLKFSVCRFPTIVIFASGSGIATAAALIESPVGVCTHISPKLRGDVRVYYQAPNR
jgi:hypothetical protein